MLVTHLTDLKNTGMAYADKERTILLDRGGLPMLMRLAEARISLKVAKGNWQVHKLSPGGRRLGLAHSRINAGELTFTASTLPENESAVMCYEVVSTDGFNSNRFEKVREK